MDGIDRETEAAVKELTRYAIINELKRKPFRRDDISKAGLLEGQNRQFGKILNLCNRQLDSIFGMELVEMRPRGYNEQKVALEKEIQAQAAKESQSQGDGSGSQTKLGKPKGGSGTTRQYVLRSKLPPNLLNKIGKVVDAELGEEDDSGVEWYQEDGAIFDWRRGDELGQLGVLGLILALILVNERALEARQLQMYLNRLGVRDTWKPPNTPASAHPPKDFDALLSQFCRQGYLECIEAAGAGAGSQPKVRRQSQAISQENQNIVWRWGARAEIEFGEKQIAEYISDLYRAAGDMREAQDADSGIPSGSNGRQIKTSHEKLMKDIEKAAGGALQDSGTLKTANDTL